jgi:hypothetical protein
VALVAVVGNGPSAAGLAADIDAHDFVIRINWFQIQAAQSTGTKLSAWVFMGNPVDPADATPPLGDYEIWYTRIPYELPGLLLAITTAANRQIRFLTEKENAALASILNAEPSSGIRAVKMAINRFHTSRINVYGFDCTTPEHPTTWKDAGEGNPGTFPWRKTNLPHNFVGEKILLQQWHDAHVINWIR